MQRSVVEKAVHNVIVEKVCDSLLGGDVPFIILLMRIYPFVNEDVPFIINTICFY